MQKIKCKNGKCWDDESEEKKLRARCAPDDIVCQTDADLIEEQL